MVILRLDKVLEATGYRSQTSIYGQVTEGTFTKPIPIGKRSVGWPDFEVEQINLARVAGATSEQLKCLVTQLMAQRERLMPPLVKGPLNGEAGQDSQPNAASSRLAA